MCLSPQTPLSILKLEGLNFAFSLLILMPKKLPMVFLKFCLGIEILLVLCNIVCNMVAPKLKTRLGIYMTCIIAKFQPVCFKKETEVNEGGRDQRVDQSL